MRALIADDDPVANKVLSRTLIRLGFDVTIARDGAEAWDALRGAEAPPLAILDWMMPQIDGPEVCRLVRRDAWRPHAYLILLTSREDPADIVAGLDAGADDYLVKPFNLAELEARVRVGTRVLGLQQGLAARVEELQAALSQVKQLSGLLPICSYCKRIRSDDNYWEQVDAYVTQHSDVRFSHGICPPCFAEVSKELDAYEKNNPSGPRTRT
jgi:sigma-B regulation protein RsbU (phosphoserine phosphatase)